MLARIQEFSADEAGRRDGERRVVDSATTIRLTDHAACDVRVCDLSPGGISFTSDQPFAIGTQVTVGLAGAGSVTGTIVRRARDVYGCTFAQRLTEQDLTAAFAADTVVSGDFGSFARPTESQDKWPLPLRAGFAIGVAASLWIGIVALVRF